MTYNHFMLDKSRLIELKWQLIGILGKGFIDLLFSTIRIESVGAEPVRDIRVS